MASGKDLDFVMNKLRELLALILLRLIGKLSIIVGRLLPRDVGDDGKDKRTGSRLVK